MDRNGDEIHDTALHGYGQGLGMQCMDGNTEESWHRSGTREYTCSELKQPYYETKQ